MDQFHYTSFAQEVIFGAGAIAQLGEAAERYHWRRLMLCTTGSLRRGGEVAGVQAALGDRLVTIYEPVMPHVPDYQVDEALARAVENEIDAVIGMGGGSPIGMAKAVSFGLEEKRTSQPAPAARCSRSASRACYRRSYHLCRFGDDARLWSNTPF